MSEADMGKVRAYVARRGRLGRVIKVSIVMDDGEMDIVVINAYAFLLVIALYRIGAWRALPSIERGVKDLAIVWRGGVRIAIAKPIVAGFVNDILDGRWVAGLADEEIYRIAEGFVCDFVSAKRKLDRGEFVAAQRWIFVQLHDVNLSLLHELRQRRGDVSFPDGRRVEQVLRREELMMVRLEVLPEREALARELKRCRRTFTCIMRGLVGDSWNWPELPSSVSAEEFRDDVL